jgi:hypothetical protein
MADSKFVLPNRIVNQRTCGGGVVNLYSHYVLSNNGTVVLSGINTYASTTTIVTGATLRVDAAGALSPILHLL